MALKFSKRASQKNTNIIKEILKVTEDPEIISFAGGLPAPELFPVKELEKTCTEVLSESGQQALQYSTTIGYLPLREQLVRRMEKEDNIQSAAENVLITTGSQQALDLTGKIFLDENDVVICESPTYLAAIDAFNAYNPKFVEIPMDEEGMHMQDLETALKNNPNIKFIYTIPDFQNPTGRTMSLERRHKIIDLANFYDVIIVEDNPYGAIRFSGADLPPIKSFDTEGRVIYISTFSKIFAPGLRLGWICADKVLIEKYAEQKQATDLNTDTFTQYITSKYMQKFSLDMHIHQIKQTYFKRQEKMLQCIDKYFPKSVHHTSPEGGLFIWIELPKHINAMDIFKICLKEKVAYVPGEAFFPNVPQKNTIRLNYSNMSESRIEIGMARLGKVLSKAINDC